MVQKIKNHWNDWLIVLALIGAESRSSIYYYLILLFITLFTIDWTRSKYTYVKPSSANHYLILDICFFSTAVAVTSYVADDNKHESYVYLIIIYQLFLFTAERGIFLRTELFKKLSYRILVKSENPESIIETKNVVRKISPWPIKNFLNFGEDSIEPRTPLNVNYFLLPLLILITAIVIFVSYRHSSGLGFAARVAFLYSALIGCVCILSFFKKSRDLMITYLGELRSSFGFALILSLVTAVCGLFIISDSLLNLRESGDLTPELRQIKSVVQSDC